MIQNKEDLRYYLDCDFLRNFKVKSIPCIRYLGKVLYGTDSCMAFHYLSTLRHYEYYLNRKYRYSIFRKIICSWYKYKMNRLRIKYGIRIAPNTVGYGFKMAHVVGGGIIINCKSMGNNCSANIGVVVGNNGGQEERPTIGDNVSLCTGCKVIGNVTIGNNVIVAPNSVVIKDVPDNCIVSGVPAQIIKELQPLE